jgi:hypothetical protein
MPEEVSGRSFGWSDEDAHSWVQGVGWAATAYGAIASVYGGVAALNAWLFGGSATAAAVGTGAATVTAPEVAAGGALVCGAAKAASQTARHGPASIARAIATLGRNRAEHVGKLAAYRSNPDAYDNAGHLARAPNAAIRQKIIDGRIHGL